MATSATSRATTLTAAAVLASSSWMVSEPPTGWVTVAVSVGAWSIVTAAVAPG